MLLMTATPMGATKLIGIKVIDKDYVMLHFRDGEVHYRDSGTGQSAYLGHSFAEGDDTLVVFGKAQPLAVWRKSKPMNFDNTLTAELDHWLFLQLPKSMKQGCTYRVAIPAGIGTDTADASIRFDIWNNQSEAVHVNIIGYSPLEAKHAADLYQWLGDGGQRDYKSLEGNRRWVPLSSGSQPQHRPTKPVARASSAPTCGTSTSAATSPVATVWWSKTCVVAWTSR